jgi:uncharacterized membrane protein
MKYLYVLAISPVVWGIAIFHNIFQLSLDSWYAFPLSMTYAAVIMVTISFIINKIT